MTRKDIVKWRTKVDWLYHSYAQPPEKREKIFLYILTVVN